MEPVSPPPVPSSPAPRPPLWRRRSFQVSAVLVTAFLLWWTVGKGRRMFVPRNFGVVEEGRIYRSGQLSRFLLERTLEEHGIDLVIDLARDDGDDADEEAQREIVKTMGLEMLQVQSLDGSGAGDPEDYVTAMKALLDARAQDQQVLVHCAAGSERTGAMVALYRMLYQGWDGDRAYEEYLSYRASEPEVPRLSRWMRENLPRIVQRLHEEGRLDQVPATLPAFGPAAQEP